MTDCGQRQVRVDRERNRRQNNKRALEVLAALVPGFDSNHDSLNVQAVCTSGKSIPLL